MEGLEAFACFEPRADLLLQKADARVLGLGFRVIGCRVDE